MADAFSGACGFSGRAKGGINNKKPGEEKKDEEKSKEILKRMPGGAAVGERHPCGGGVRQCAGSAAGRGERHLRDCHRAGTGI